MTALHPTTAEVRAQLESIFTIRNVAKLMHGPSRHGCLGQPLATEAPAHGWDSTTDLAVTREPSQEKTAMRNTEELCLWK